MGKDKTPYETWRALGRASRTRVEAQQRREPCLFRLLGGFHCYVTADELNGWAQGLADSPVAQEYDHLHAQMAILKVGVKETGDRSKMQALLDRRLEIEKMLFDIGAEWYAYIVKERETEAASGECE